MNILILSWRDPKNPLSGGAEKVTLTHAKYWVEQGNTVFWLTSSYCGCLAQEEMEGVNIIRGGSSIYYTVIIKTFFWYLFEPHPKFDVVVDQFHGLPFFSPLYIKKPIIGFIHELGSRVVQYNPWPRPFNLLPTILAPICEPLIFKFFYKNTPFITVSQSTKTDLEALGMKNVTIIPNGIDIPRGFSMFSKQDKFTVIFLSQLTKDKGIGEAIKTYELVKKKIPDSQLWIVGKGEPDYVANLKKLAPFAKFWGYVSDLKKFELLSKSHVFLFPSVHEGWGLVILEAAAVGTPAVAYRVSGVKDAIVHGQTGLTASDQTPESLANLVLELNNNKKLYSRLCSNAKAWSRNFSWDKSIKLSLNLLKKVVFTESL